MKKKIFFAIATGFFAVATVFNMNVLQGGGVGDISLDAIAVMAQAQNGENSSKGVSTILIQDGGSSEPCINGVIHHCQIYTVVCLGEGELLCTPGTFESCAPTQRRCVVV